MNSEQTRINVNYYCIKDCYGKVHNFLYFQIIEAVRISIKERDSLGVPFIASPRLRHRQLIQPCVGAALCSLLRYVPRLMPSFHYLRFSAHLWLFNLLVVVYKCSSTSFWKVLPFCFRRHMRIPHMHSKDLSTTRLKWSRKQEIMHSVSHHILKI